MGTWDYGIFDNDTALDVRGDFEGALAEGLDVEAATERIFDEYAEALDDPDDGPVIRLALAALQLEHGALQPAVRDAALEVIDGGEGIRRFEEEWPEGVPDRTRVLQELRVRLVAGA